mmetsp:Transcript_8914/g.11815  ORF Transcript_8914/g.11815 Transcript_8914/m.11815 type:complete len:136 (-) Transcript_8914:360-767(-)
MVSKSGKNIQGRPVSGRVWKKPQKRASFKITNSNKQLSSSWEKKMEERKKKELYKQRIAEMKEQKRAEIEAKKKEKEEREARRQRNELKGTQYQLIHKTGKLKGMSKKQLRQIKKTQINRKTGELELVDAFSKNK